MKKEKIKMIRNILLGSLLVAFVGCGDNPKEQNKTSELTTAPQIEIVANENAKEIKVATKDSNGSEENTFYKGMTNELTHSYNPNSQPANKDASVRIKPRTRLQAQQHIRSPYEKIQIGLLVKKLSKEFMVKCSACHDDYANGVIGPSLLGKSSDEIFDKIVAFKSGKKSNVLMDGLIDRMSEEAIRKLADEISEFNKKIKEMRSR
jgi:cytochrome c553